MFCNLKDNYEISIKSSQFPKTLPTILYSLYSVTSGKESCVLKGLKSTGSDGVLVYGIS